MLLIIFLLAVISFGLAAVPTLVAPRRVNLTALGLFFLAIYVGLTQGTI